MEIRSIFLSSTVADPGELKSSHLPEYAMLGRSNVGKSSLINMLLGRKNLAFTSSDPGKTRTINHYIINDQWGLVDLPGYGYARVSKTERAKWLEYTRKFLLSRENLSACFILLDMRHPLQVEDAAWMKFLAKNGIPLVRIFTKSDKLKNAERARMMKLHDQALVKDWEFPPPAIITSAEKKTGRSKMLDLIDRYNQEFNES